MKVYHAAIIVGVVLALVACGAKKEPANSEEYVANGGKPEAMTAPDVIAQGEALVKANDCNTCHHKINTIIGPAHTAVAKKYEFTEANVKYLAKKIMTGGTGVWGEIPMAAHADLSQQDADTMARYVLSLDGEKEH